MNARDRAGARYALHGYRRDLARVLGYGMRVAPRRMRAKGIGRRVVRRWDQGGDGVQFARGARVAAFAGPVTAVQMVAGVRRGVPIRREAVAAGLGTRGAAGGIRVAAAVRRVMVAGQRRSVVRRVVTASGFGRHVRGKQWSGLETVMRRSGGSVVWRQGARRAGDAVAGAAAVVSAAVVSKVLGGALREVVGSRRRDGVVDLIGGRRHLAKRLVHADGRLMRRSIAPVAQGHVYGRMGESSGPAVAFVAGRDGASAWHRPSSVAPVDDRRAGGVGPDAQAGRRGGLGNRDALGSNAGFFGDRPGAAIAGSGDVAFSVGSLFTDEARRPPSGVTGFDGRLSPFFAGRKPGF